MNKRAFLLFEVALTIAILSVGLVIVIRSISVCMKTARASFNYSQAINLAGQKASELERDSQIDGLETTQDEGAFADNERFKWRYTVQELSENQLGKLILDVYWQEGKRQEGFDIVTYIKTKE